MIVSIRYDSKLQKPRLRDLLLDPLDFSWIHIRNNDFNLVIASRPHHRIIHPGRIDSFLNRSDELFGGHPKIGIVDRRFIDLVDQVRSTLDVRPELELTGGNHDPCPDHC